MLSQHNMLHDLEQRARALGWLLQSRSAGGSQTAEAMLLPVAHIIGEAVQIAERMQTDHSAALTATMACAMLQRAPP